MRVQGCTRIGRLVSVEKKTASVVLILDTSELDGADEELVIEYPIPESRALAAEIYRQAAEAEQEVKGRCSGR